MLYDVAHEQETVMSGDIDIKDVLLQMIQKETVKIDPKGVAWEKRINWEESEINLLWNNRWTI